MVRKPFALAVALALLINPVVCNATSTTPILLERSESWNLDYDNESCKLAAAFGNGDDRIVIRLTRFQPSDLFELAVFGKALRDSKQRSTIALNFGPAGQLTMANTINGELNKIPVRMIGAWWLSKGWGSDAKQSISPHITPEQEKAVSYLDLQPEHGRLYRLDLVSMAQPMAALRGCTDDLIRAWGFDPAQQAALQRSARPQGMPGTWVTLKDYPSSSSHVGELALVTFRLDIDETGAASGCHIQMSTDPERFNKLTCKLLLSRAHFDPALDANGNPVKSFYLNRVQWTVR